MAQFTNIAKQIKAGVIGGAGYTGGELIRLLLNHPFVDIHFVNSNSNAGNPVYKVHQDLLGETNLQFTSDLSALQDGSIDVLFLCLGHGDSKKFLSMQLIHESIKIVDLANDFRLNADAQTGTRKFVYGLPELQREQIKTAANIANPGCFATAIQLGLLPLAKAGWLKEVHTTGITGSTGAGQSLSNTSHFSWRANNIQAYKTLTHQHNAEILQSINSFNEEGILTEDDFNFVPWRGDFTRGIFISSQVRCEMELVDLYKLYTDFYEGHPFTSVSREPVFLKQVVNTNKAIIQLEKAGNKLVIHAVIDNLLKGACGQAVQNMNLLFGFEETAGLKLKANCF